MQRLPTTPATKSNSGTAGKEGAISPEARDKHTMCLDGAEPCEGAGGGARGWVQIGGSSVLGGFARSLLEAATTKPAS